MCAGLTKAVRERMVEAQSMPIKKAAMPEEMKTSLMEEVRRQVVEAQSTISVKAETLQAV